MAETIGGRLRRVRGEMSQIEFALRLDADKNTVGRYERGERTPDGDFLLRLRLEFDTNIDWLLTGENPSGLWTVDKGGSRQPFVPAPVIPPASAVLDEELLSDVLSELERFLAERGLALPPEKKARVAVELYCAIQEADAKKLAVDPTLMQRLVRVAS